MFDAGSKLSQIECPHCKKPVKPCTAHRLGTTLQPIMGNFCRRFFGASLK
jgi:hypothetical protein